MIKPLYGLLFLALITQAACSEPTPAMRATSTPSIATTPETTNASTELPVPLQTVTEMLATPTAIGTPGNGEAKTQTSSLRFSSESDREALIALYEATGGPNWSNDEHWLSGLDIKYWHGVTVGSDGQVTKLFLHDNGLEGKIPPELGDLSNLRMLDLSVNRLEGEIPPELGSLTNLEELNIFWNQLTGEIPPELGNLVNLEVLYLSGNRLSGQIPPELGKLHRLVELRMNDNALTGCIPDSLQILHYLPEDVNLPFCAPAVHSETEMVGERADYLGPNTEWIDPLLVTMLYEQAAGKAPTDMVRLGIGRDTRISVEPPLETFIEDSGGTPEGEYIWLMPVSLVPSVICRPDVIAAGLVGSDGTLSWESREQSYHNLNAVLNDVVVAHQGGMPENQAVLYALYVRGNAIAVDVQIRDSEMEDSVRAWLADRNIYAIPKTTAYADYFDVHVMLPVGRILALAERFPEAYLGAADIMGQGIPMLRSQWQPEALLFERQATQQYVAPGSDTGQTQEVLVPAPCSPASAGMAK